MSAAEPEFKPDVTPLNVSSLRIVTHRLREKSPRLLLLEPGYAIRSFAAGFFVAAAIVLCFGLSDAGMSNRGWFAFGILILGGSVLWFMPHRFEFDRDLDEFRDVWLWSKKAYPLSSIGEVQLIDGGRHGDYKEFVHYTYQLNVAFRPPLNIRLNLTNHANYAVSLANGRRIRQFLDVPLYNPFGRDFKG